MHTNKRLVTIILAAALWLMMAAYATAASAGYKTWQHKTSGDVKKVWSIRFSRPLDAAAVNSNTVYVTDANGKRIDAKLALTDDKKTVKVTPVSPYTFGKRYNIYVTADVTAANGTHLGQPVIIPFAITNDNIISVDSAYTSFITGLTVTTSSNVFRVTANGIEMHYEGDNVYTLGMASLKPGDTVTINAYDAGGKLIESTKHSIE